MKRTLAIFAVALATLAHAAGYEDWFTPSKGWSGYTVPVNISIAGASINREFPVTFSLSDVQYILDGVTEDVPSSAKNAFELSKAALANSIFASCQAMMNKTKIDNLGAALEGVFVSTYGQYVDEAGNVISKSKSGVDTAKLRQQLLANKNAVVSGGQAAGGSEANPLTLVITQKPYDESQFEQHVADGKSLTSLKGWYNLSDTPTAGLDGADGWALAYADYFIPFSVGKSGNLGWVKWNGWDAGCFSAGDDVSGGENNKPLRLYGWATADNCSESIQNLLTNVTATVDRSKHKILTRYGDGNSATIHWMPFDESVIGGGSEQVADDRSIVYTQDEDASPDDPKKFRLKGFDAAKPESASDGAVLPFVDATSDDLQWGSIMNFFADSVFRQSSETGKILLNGTSEEGKVKVLAMTGNGGDDQTITALTFDNASIDGNPAVGGVVQLHGFDIAPSPYASGDVSFADVLTNTTTQITGMSVPVRVPEQGSPAGYAVKYVPMGKIAGIPAAAVDNKTIEVNEADPQNKFLQLHGAAGEGITLEEGDVYQIGRDGKGKFSKIGADDDDDGVTSENASIETYIGDDGGKYFRLRDWMLNREGTPHLLGWEEHNLKYWEVTGEGGIEISDTTAGDFVHLSNFDSAGEGGIPYAKKDGNGLGWLNGVDDRIPLLHTDAAPTTMAIGSSLDKANVSAVPTLNIANFASGGNCSVSLNKMLSDQNEASNRSAHQFMARYSSGGGEPSVHWVSIDGIVGGGSPVDNASITTNYSAGASVDGTASLYGFRTASEGDVPHKKNDGTIEWKAAAGSSAPDGYSTSTNETGTVGKLSIKGWNGSSYYPSSYSYTTLATDLASSSTKSYYLVARNNYGSIAYIPVGTMPTTPPRCFQYNTSTHKFENLYFRWGRTEKTATDSFGARTSGTAYLVINHSTGAGVLQASSASNTDTQTCVKIATISGGVVTMDYTNMPTIPAYE